LCELLEGDQFVFKNRSSEFKQFLQGRNEWIADVNQDPQDEEDASQASLVVSLLPALVLQS